MELTPEFLNSGPGFGGSCFKKDILNLVYLSNHYGLNEVANFWESVVTLNTWHQHRISQLIVKKLFGTITGKKICILGFAFKENTNDTRESAAITICKDLLEEGALLAIHDPKVERKQIEKDLSTKENPNIKFLESNMYKYSEGNWCYAEEINEAIQGSDAVIVLTGWGIYKNIDWGKVTKIIRRPAWVFDVRSILSKEDFEESDLNLWMIGDGSII